VLPPYRAINLKKIPLLFDLPSSYGDKLRKADWRWIQLMDSGYLSRLTGI